MLYGLSGNYIISMGTNEAFLSTIDTTGFTFDETYNLKLTADAETP